MCGGRVCPGAVGDNAAAREPHPARHPLRVLPREAALALAVVALLVRASAGSRLGRSARRSRHAPFAAIVDSDFAPIKLTLH
jgi:hypothetical protein